MRRWETVFPEADRKVYMKAGMCQREPFGKRPALLIIDVVGSFTGSRPQPVLDAIDEYKLSCGEAGWQALGGLRQILDAARGAGLPVVYTKGDPLYKAFCGDSAKGYAREEIIRMHSTEIPDLIKPLESELVIRKTKASAFFSTPLSTYLRRLGVDSLLVGGTSTSGCVRASVIDAYSHGFTVFVIEECCFDRSEFSHLVNLFEMNAKYANVITLEEALAYVKGLPR